MFRGKESSNRIKLSWLVQDLLNFDLGSLQLWGRGWVDGGVGWLGVPPTHIYMHVHRCMHAHTCTCMCGKHDNFMQMATPIGGIPGNSLWCHTHVHVCACTFMCVHTCAHVWGHPSTTPHPQLPTPTPQGGTPRISKNSIALELIKIYSRYSLTHGWVYGFGEWVGVLMGQITKNFKNVDWIKIIQFYLKIYDL